MKSKPVTRLTYRSSVDSDYELLLGDWLITDAPLSNASGNCVTDNNNVPYGDGGELWSTCAGYFGETRFTVSQYANGSYALAGTFPIEFDNALGFSPTEGNSPFYQFPVKFFTSSGTCEVSFHITIRLGRTKEDFQIET
ncbi:uncharacterized protein Z518_04943 [Rhinocladiella mackenziei CBS 650.93]|uniref:Uncharacterized protein n=1 Tax=Rhinocladiella mackenziei CBS 650.93 TaxID=1442369 RepID=A0A0D2FXC2_9EURO|nr:uncharacterized protein Z518_04943 [Rhinocladiella mackenziei CBS 650.93]KIX06967.1 hypothetical protein Z518_04943 [Rhinocladiella mackenziei CBS 650.93]